MSISNGGVTKCMNMKMLRVCILYTKRMIRLYTKRMIRREHRNDRERLRTDSDCENENAVVGR